MITGNLQTLILTATALFDKRLSQAFKMGSNALEPHNKPSPISRATSLTQAKFFGIAVLDLIQQPKSLDGCMLIAW